MLHIHEINHYSWHLLLGWFCCAPFSPIVAYIHDVEYAWCLTWKKCHVASADSCEKSCGLQHRLSNAYLRTTFWASTRCCEWNACWTCKPFTKLFVEDYFFRLFFTYIRQVWSKMAVKENNQKSVRNEALFVALAVAGFVRLQNLRKSMFPKNRRKHSERVRLTLLFVWRFLGVVFFPEILYSKMTIVFFTVASPFVRASLVIHDQLPSVASSAAHIRPAVSVWKWTICLCQGVFFGGRGGL